MKNTAKNIRKLVHQRGYMISEKKAKELSDLAKESGVIPERLIAHILDDVDKDKQHTITKKHVERASRYSLLFGGRTE